MAAGQEKTALNIKNHIRGLIRGLNRARRSYNPRKEKAPKNVSKWVSGLSPEQAWAGYKRQGTGGSESLVAFLPSILAEKVLGKERVREAFWKYVNAPALKADSTVGHAIGKVPGLKGLFTVKEKIPVGKDLWKQVERTSALAPIVKARDIAAPVIIGVGLEKGLGKITKPKEESKIAMDQNLREKVASTLLHLNSENKKHTKRAHAIKLLYKKAELGLEQVPSSFNEFEEKVASLLTQDLVILEKALELAGGQFKLGELDSSPTFRLNASEQFQAAVLDD